MESVYTKSFAHKKVISSELYGVINRGSTSIYVVCVYLYDRWDATDYDMIGYMD